MLEVRPQRGTFVRNIAKSAVMDAGFVREAIEADIVKQSAGTPDTELVKELRARLVEQRKSASRDPIGFIELDEQFHRTLAEAAGKSCAWSVIESVRP